MLCSFLVFVQLECRFGVLVQSVVLCNVGLMQIHACVELMQKSIRFIERAEKVKRGIVCGTAGKTAEKQHCRNRKTCLTIREHLLQRLILCPSVLSSDNTCTA